MKVEKLNIYEQINKSKITQRDRFILLLILSLSGLVNSFTALLAVKQLPDIVKMIIEEVQKFL